MKANLVFEDWRKLGENKSIANTKLGVELSLGDLHSGTIFDGEINIDNNTQQEILKYWKKHKAYPVFRVIPK